MKTVFFLVMLSALFTVGCGTGRNVAKGNGYYPLENSNPKMRYVVKGSTPELLNFSFDAFYEAGNSESSPCRYFENKWAYVFSGASKSTIALPLRVSRFNTNQFALSVIADQFVPDQCNWQLVALRITEPTALGPIWIHMEKKSSQYSGNPINIWCTSRPKSLTTDSNLDCRTFKEELRDKALQPASFALDTGVKEFVLNIHYEQK